MISRMAGAFARLAGEPTGSGGRGQSRWNDATGLAEQEQPVPKVGSDGAAAVRSEETRLEIERAK